MYIVFDYIAIKNSIQEKEIIPFKTHLQLETIANDLNKEKLNFNCRSEFFV